MNLRSIAYLSVGIALGASASVLASGPGAISQLFVDLGGGVYRLAGGNIQPGTVGTAQLANVSVTSAKLAAGAVGTAQIADSSVTNVKLAPGAGNDDLGNHTATANLNLAGHAIVNASGFSLVDGTQGAGKVLTSNAAGSGSWQSAPPAAWASVTGKPTTVAGFGITDMSAQSVNRAATATSVDWSGVANVTKKAVYRGGSCSCSSSDSCTRSSRSVPLSSSNLFFSATAQTLNYEGGSSGRCTYSSCSCMFVPSFYGYVVN